MTLNKEELALVLLAVLYWIASLAIVLGVGPLIAGWVDLPSVLVSTPLQILLAVAALIVVQRIPSGWYFVVVYRSKDAEPSAESSEVSHSDFPARAMAVGE